jgi:hypothetical protein
MNSSSLRDKILSGHHAEASNIGRAVPVKKKHKIKRGQRLVGILRHFGLDVKVD